MVKLPNFILVVGQDELERRAVNVRNRDDVGEKKTRRASDAPSSLCWREAIRTPRTWKRNFTSLVLEKEIGIFRRSVRADRTGPRTLTSFSTRLLVQRSTQHHETKRWA